MATSSQRKASANHRKRITSRGLVRVEVQASPTDIRLLREIARGLRQETKAASELRRKLQRAVGEEAAQDGFGIFGSDLPDEVFAGVFEQRRDENWRDIDL